MKRFYSVILLLSFLVGALQPILPMIKYELQESSSILTFFGESSPEADNPQIKDCFTAQSSSSTHTGDHDQSLLNDNYYPLGIDTAMVPSMFVFPHTNQLYPPAVQNIESPSFLPNPPPPRVA